MNKEIKKSTRYLASKEDFENTKTEMIKWLVGLFFCASFNDNIVTFKATLFRTFL